MRESPDAINRRATEWVARLDACDLNETEQLMLKHWLAADRRHQGAFLRAEAAWVMLNGAAALDIHAQGRVQKGVTERRGAGWPYRRLAERNRRSWAHVAVFALFIMSGVIPLALTVRQSAGEPLATRVGEIRHIPLEDGSVALVNTGSAMRVRMQAARREVELTAGEAWFKVAKDKQRPFIVAAGDVRVKAVGTAFSVRRESHGAEVLVTEGVVEVWSTEQGRSVRVPAGSRIFVGYESGPAMLVRSATAIENSLAWRSGEIVLDGTSLGEAAAEFNRYNQTQIIVSDPLLAHEKLVGRFRTYEPDSFARAAASMLGAHVRIEQGAILLSRRNIPF